MGNIIQRDRRHFWAGPFIDSPGSIKYYPENSSVLRFFQSIHADRVNENGLPDLPLG